MRRFTLIFSVAVTGCLFWGAASAAELQEAGLPSAVAEKIQQYFTDEALHEEK